MEVYITKCTVYFVKRNDFLYYGCTILTTSVRSAKWKVKQGVTRQLKIDLTMLSSVYIYRISNIHIFIDVHST
jgi:hypothetical protein